MLYVPDTGRLTKSENEMNETAAEDRSRDEYGGNDRSHWDLDASEEN